MLVVRAISYFYLVNVFGNIPLVTATGFGRKQIPCPLAGCGCVPVNTG